MSRRADPVAALARPGVRLFLTSAALLFLELLLLRWIPANVIYVGFFSNFLLVGSFLGIGVGILLGGLEARFPAPPFAALFFAIVALVTRAQLNVQVSSSHEIFFGLSESKAADTNFLVLPLVVALTTLVLASLALPLGALLRSMPPLRAYAIDVAGSLAGIAAFTALGAAWTAPWVWLVVLGFLVVLLALGRGLDIWSVANGALYAGAVLIVATSGPPGETWSPYYRISTHRGEFGLPEVMANGIPHQIIWPAATVEDPSRANLYQQVYHWFPERRFERVCIVGAGNGIDTAVALRHGAGHVDSVEIDPVIASIGRRWNPDRPYDDPRVALHVQDGRNFVRNADGLYDLVIFALPDSLTLVSTTANLRLESFLFTREAFADVRRHLAPHGVFVLYNFYRQPWLVAKIEGMLASVFGGGAPLVQRGGGVAAIFAVGPGVDEARARLGPGDPPSSAPPAPATDDWPFLYLLEPGIPGHYLLSVGIVLAFAALLVVGACRATGVPVGRASPHFFALGAAFLLIETRSIVHFSLLFGNTWIVNALTFFAILSSVLVSILVSAVFPVRRPWPLYLGLLASLVVGVVVVPESLLFEPAWLRYLVASAIAFSPVFFANLVFTRSFRDAKAADMAFASNLLGAILGGALEYLSLLVGFRALVVLSGVLYALAWLLGSRLRLLGDRDLEDAPAPAPPAA